MRELAQAPSRAQTEYLITFKTGGTAYYPATIEAGIASTSVPYSRVGSVLNCSSFANLKTLYEDINNAAPAPITMGERWVMEDLNKSLEFQVNNEPMQRLRLVKRFTAAHTDQTSIARTYETFYVPVFVAFDATSPSSIFDAVYVSRSG